MDSGLDPSLMLAATNGPKYEPLEAAQMRTAQVAQAQQGLAAGAQDLALGGQKQQMNDYALRESATQLQEQQTLMQGVNDTLARRAASANPAAPIAPTAAQSSMPAPAAPFMRNSSGMIVRDPAAGQVAGPNDPIMPGMVGVAPNAVPSNATPAAGVPSGNASTPDPRSALEETLDNVQGKVRPATLIAWQGQNLAMKDKMANIASLNAKTAEATQNQQDAERAGLGTLMQTVKDAGYSKQSLGFALSYLDAHGHGEGANLIRNQWAQNPDDIKGLVDPFISQRSPQGIEATAKETSGNADASLTNAKVPGADAESQRQQMTTQMMRDALDHPEEGEKLIDQALPASVDAQANSSFHAQYQAAKQTGDLAGMAKAVGDAANHAAAISRATNPDIQNAEINKSVRVAQATAPIETAKAIATAKALRQGDNPAVAGVAPASIGQVQNSAIKLDNDYIKAKSATDSMGALLDLAGRGNKAAGSGLPLVGVETLNALNGIKRVNSAEISQYGSAGSLLDQIQGKIGKLTQGQPIPQDVLNDIRQLHQTLGSQAYQQYSDGLNSLNQRTGANFKPTIGAPNISGQGALPKGNGQLIDKATVQKFYNAAGGDPAKTRQLIQQNNWKLQ